MLSPVSRHSKTKAMHLVASQKTRRLVTTTGEDSHPRAHLVELLFGKLKVPTWKSNSAVSAAYSKTKKVGLAISSMAFIWQGIKRVKNH